MKKMPATFKIHGGKFYLRNFVINHFPKNYIELPYLELFGGAASVLIQKIPSVQEIYNDIHQPTYSIFNQLKTSDQFVNSIQQIEYNEESFEKAKKGFYEEALNELILRRMSRGGMKKEFSWSERLRGGIPGDVNAWNNFKKSIHLICNRLKNVEMFCDKAINIIEKHKDKKVLFYLDPPYLPSTRTAKKVYDHEMTEEDHGDLADSVKVVKGKVLISGYDSPFYRHLYNDWNWAFKDVPNNSGQNKNKQRRKECLIMNF